MDPNVKLSREQQFAELLKCKNDPVYFINNYVYIEETGGRIPFKTYPKQEEYVRRFVEDHYIIVLKSRQIGISTISQAICAWSLVFYSYVTIGVISRDGPEATEFARKTRELIESLPKWMQPGFKKKTEQTFILKNGSALYSSTVNKSNPSSVFRGKTLTILVIDEAAFIEKIEYAYTGIAPATTRAHKVAEQKGIPYGIMIISTPQGTHHPVGYWYYNMWKKAVNGESAFVPIKIHYKDAPFTDEEWVKKQRSIITSELDWEQEMELKFLTGKDSFVNYETSIKLQESESPPIKKYETVYFNRNGEQVGSGEWRWWTLPETNKVYIAGIDIAGGYVGNCNSAIEIIDADTLMQIAEFEGKLRVGDLKEEIVKLVDQFYNNIIIVPEMNSVGIRLVEELEEDDKVYEFLYYTKIFNKEGKLTKKIPGIATTGKTRPAMIDALYWTITEDPLRIRSSKLISQLISLDKNLRGGLSDLSMAMAIATYVARKEKDLIENIRPVIHNYKDEEFLDDLFINGNQLIKDEHDFRYKKLL